MSRTKGSKNRQNRNNQSGTRPAKAKVQSVKVDEQISANEALDVINEIVSEPAKPTIPTPERSEAPEKPEVPERFELDQIQEQAKEEKDVSEIAKVEIKEPEYLDKFWFGNVFVPGVGTVNGRVRTDHFEQFKNRFESGQARLPKADRLKLNIDYWVRDNDELDKKLKEGKKVKT